MNTNVRFEVLQWIWEGKKSSEERRLRFTISKEMNFFDPVSICFKFFFWKQK